jgi:hypothetical protein
LDYIGNNESIGDDMYIKYPDYNGQLNEGNVVLMSLAEFENGGKDLKGVPIAVTPDGAEPIEVEEIESITQPEPQPHIPTEEERLQATEEALLTLLTMGVV